MFGQAVPAEILSQTMFDELVEKYVEMNIAHPFGEGSGRSTRLRLALFFKKELHKVADGREAAEEEYLLATERSPVMAASPAVYPVRTGRAFRKTTGGAFGSDG